jgi:hypothetical protein
MAHFLKNNLLNIVFVGAIIALAFWAIKIELKSFKNYQKDIELSRLAIDWLSKNKHTEISKNNSSENLFTWFINHLDGKFEGQVFKPRREHDRFVLISYPTDLSKAVPRSLVYFTPTLLTALGILGTFAGVFIGLQDVKTDNTQELLASSNQLISGMKMAFATSLAGLSGASILMWLIADRGKKKEKHRNKLRQQLNDIAFLETSERLLSKLDRTSNYDSASAIENVAKNLEGLSQLNPDTIALAISKAIAFSLMKVAPNSNQRVSGFLQNLFLLIATLFFPIVYSIAKLLVWSLKVTLVLKVPIKTIWN